jgi:hypothetical protein
LSRRAIASKISGIVEARAALFDLDLSRESRSDVLFDISPRVSADFMNEREQNS